jgi:hypothetical protein
MFDPTNEEEVSFAFNYPYGRVRGTPVKAYLCWCATTGDVGNVVWGAERTFTTPAGIPKTVISESPSAVAGDKVPVTVSLTPDPARMGLLVPSSTVFVRFYRAAGHIEDTYPADAAVLNMKIAYVAATGRLADNGLSVT